MKKVHAILCSIAVLFAVVIAITVSVVTVKKNSPKPSEDKDDKENDDMEEIERKIREDYDECVRANAGAPETEMFCGWILRRTPEEYVERPASPPPAPAVSKEKQTCIEFGLEKNSRKSVQEYCDIADDFRVSSPQAYKCFFRANPQATQADGYWARRFKRALYKECGGDDIAFERLGNGRVRATIVIRGKNPLKLWDDCHEHYGPETYEGTVEEVAEKLVAFIPTKDQVSAIKKPHVPSREQVKSCGRAAIYELVYNNSLTKAEYDRAVNHLVRKGAIY